MNAPSSKIEQILKLHQIETKTGQFRELSRDDRFALFLKRLEESWTYQEKGYGVK